MCDCKAYNRVNMTQKEKEESEVFFGQHWPLFYMGFSFCLNKTHKVCQCMKDWILVDRCIQCGRLFHRCEEDNEHAGFCGRHRGMRPQMGVVERDEPPFWLFDYWLILIAVISLCMTPTTSFMWDLVYGLFFVCIFVMTVYSCIYFALLMWRMIFGPQIGRAHV